MTKQELAQKRNYFKMVLMGLYKPVDTNALSEREKEKWLLILKIKDELLEHFTQTSKQTGLKIKEKTINFQKGNHNLLEIRALLSSNGFKKVGHSKGSPIGYHINFDRKIFYECSAFLNPTVRVIFHLDKLKEMI